MHMNTVKTEKVVFKEDEYSRAKVLYGTVKEIDNDFIEVITTQGNVFTINKKNLIFRKAGGC
jgi:hypothetical protein